MKDEILRIPPHNLDAERAVLGAVLMAYQVNLPRVVALRASDFFTEAHREIFDAILSLGANGSAIDLITLSEELRRRDQLDFVGGPAMLSLIVEQASIAAYVPEYVAIVRQKAIVREVIQIATTAVAEAFDDRVDAQLILDLARDRFDEIAKRAIIAEKPFVALTAAELLALEIPDPVFLLHGWIPAGALTFVVGDSEAFKSWFTLLLAVCVAAGRTFMGMHVVQGPTLVISEENGLPEDKRRVGLIFRGLRLDPVGVPIYVASDTSFNFDDRTKYNAMRAFVQEHGVTTIVVDSLVRVHRRQEKDAGEMSALYTERVKPLNREGVAVIVLHHRRKLATGANGAVAPVSDNDEIRGSGDLRAAAHAVLFLKLVSNDKVVVRHNKARGWKKQEAYVFSMKDGDDAGGAFVTLTNEGKPVEALDRREACKLAILEFAAAQESRIFTQTQLESHFQAEKKAGRTSFSRKVYGPMLKELSKDGVPLQLDSTGRLKFYKLVRDDEPDDDELEPGARDVPF